MKRSLVIIVFAISLTAGLPGDDDAVGAATCTRPHSMTVTKNGSGRVLQSRRSGPDGPRTYGCLFKFDTLVPLDNPEARDYARTAQVDSMRLAGWLAGYARDFIGGEGMYDVGGTMILVRSLHPRGKARRVFHAEPPEHLKSNCDDESCDTRVSVPDLVLRGKGAVAWIVCPVISARKRRCAESDPASVYKVDSTAQKRVRLDQSAGIDIFSLRLQESRLSWTRDGVTHSARLR